MQIRYGGTPAIALALLALSPAACSSDGDRSDEATATPTVSASTTLTPAPSRSAVVSASPSAAARPSPTPSPTRSPRPSASPTRSPKPSPKPSPTPSPTRKSVTYAVSAVTGDLFDPDRLTLRVGDRVRVTNDDTTDDHDFVIGALNVSSGNMTAGDTFTYRFLKAGTFDFICSYHDQNGMTGTVTVKP